MQVQRTNLQQSAAGSLLAALAKSDKADATFFQQQFTESLEAVGPRRRPPERRQEQVGGEPAGAPQRAEVDRPPPQTEGPARVADPEPRQSVQRNERTAPDSGGADDRAKVEADAAETPAAAPASPAGGSDTAAAGAAQQAPEQTQPAAQPEEPEAGAQDSPAPQAVRGASAAAATLMRVLASQASAGVLAAVQEAAPGSAESQPKTADAGQASRPAAAQLRAEVMQEMKVPPPEQALSLPLPSADADEPRPLGLKAGRARVLRQEVQQVDSRRDERAVSPQKSGGVEKPSTNQNTTAQAMRNLNLQSQQVRAEVVSITVAATPPAGPAPEAGSGEAAARIGAATEAPQSVAAAAPRARSAEPAANQAEQIERIARVIRASLSRGGSRVNLQLEPPDLGRLRVQMQLRGADLFARFETQTDSARLWLEQNLGQLRESLASSGVRLVEATVQQRGAENDAAGARSGGAGGFLGDARGGAPQPQHGQNYSGGTAGGETDSPPWAEVPAGSEQLDVVA